MFLIFPRDGFVPFLSDLNQSSSSVSVRRWLAKRRLKNMVSTQNDVSEAAPTPSTVTLNALTETFSRWSRRTRLSQKQELLWIATDRKENNGHITGAVFKLLLKMGFGPLHVNVERQRTVLAPLIYSLEQLPSYRTEFVRLARMHGFPCLEKGLEHVTKEPQDVSPFTSTAVRRIQLG